MLFRSACLLLAACSLHAATVTGQVELQDSKEDAVRKSRNFSGVAVWLEPVSGVVNVRPTAHGLILQKNKQFLPHVLVTPVGAAVDFPNNDPIFHNAFSSFNGKAFDLGLYPPGTKRTVTFDREGIVRVFCNIHATMSAVIVVVRTPYYAVSDREGRFQIPDVPPGDYRLRVFHERATDAVLKGLTRRISVGAEAVAIPAIKITESGYLPMPHKNKFGQDYPDPEDRLAYPGVK